MTVFLIGDGVLARELALTIREAGHALTTLFLDTHEGGERTLSLEDVLPERVALVVEAVITEPTDKWDSITELDRLLDGEVPILTAALNASATEVASWCHDGGRVVGFAALPPLAGSRAIELLAARQSRAQSVQAARAFWQSLGKEPVAVRDSVGGVMPRVLCNLVNEATFALMEGVATPEDIDEAMQLGTNWPRGPLAWADAIGLEQVVAILEALGNEFGPDQYRPAPLLRQLARAGQKMAAYRPPLDA